MDFQASIIRMLIGEEMTSRERNALTSKSLMDYIRIVESTCSVKHYLKIYKGELSRPLLLLPLSKCQLLCMSLFKSCWKDLMEVQTSR